MKNLILAVALTFMMTTAFAAKPDWAGQGKPEQADIEAMAEEARDRINRMSGKAKDKPNRGKPNKDKDDSDEDEFDEEEHDEEDEVECELTKEECAALRAEKKAEREALRAERAAERQAARAEREAERAANNPELAERMAEREAARAEREAARGENGQGQNRRGENGQGQRKGPPAEVIAEKTEAAQNELNNGAAIAQETQETKSRKWWRFWEWGDE